MFYERMMVLPIKGIGFGCTCWRFLIWIKGAWPLFRVSHHGHIRLPTLTLIGQLGIYIYIYMYMIFWLPNGTTPSTKMQTIQECSILLLIIKGFGKHCPTMKNMICMVSTQVFILSFKEQTAWSMMASSSSEKSSCSCPSKSSLKSHP